MRPEFVVQPAPPISQEQSLKSCGEQLDIDELIAEPPVERLGKAFLPGGSRRDVARARCPAGLAPVS